MSRRTERVAEQVRAELARLLREEVTDPRIQLVTLTRIDVSPDLGSARVFWSTPAADDAEGARGVGEGLESAAPFLRRRLARLLPVKRVPALYFHYDPSLALGERTLALLRDLSDEADGEPPDGQD